MRLTKMIYIASPYTFKKPGVTNLTREAVQTMRYELITEIAAALEIICPYALILPITMSYNTAKYLGEPNGEFAYWARRDLTYISRCDEVWVVKMEGWDESIGVKEEIKFALKNGIKVRYINPDLVDKMLLKNKLIFSPGTIEKAK